MMNRKKKRICLVSIVTTAVLACGSLAACGDFPAVYTSTPKEGKIELNGLSDDSEGQMSLSFEDGVIRVELESGTVDMTLVDIVPMTDDDTIPIELGSFYEGTGLQDGDEINYTDSDGEFLVRITGHDTTGIITFSKE